MIKINNVKIPYKTKEESYINYVAKKLRCSISAIKELTLIRRSLDARKSNEICYVCTFSAITANENKLIKKIGDVSHFDNSKYEFAAKDISCENPPVIVGSGPAGIFCALMLARAGLNPIVVERGEDVDSRKISVNEFWNGGILNPNSNVQFGEGGAGTFSDGKLTCGVNDIRMDFVKQEFVNHGAPQDILTNAKPHIGTDYLAKTIKAIRKEIISLGGSFMFNHLMTDIDVSDSSLKGIFIKNTIDGNELSIPCSVLVCAIGHSSRETYEMMLKKGFEMERKPFSVGVRIEHKREYINKLRYKEAFEDTSLPTADYKLSCHPDGRGTYTFCMCPGGKVVAGASEVGGVVTNGMSDFGRLDNNSNSAVLVSVTPEDINGDNVLGGMYFQRDLEQKAFAAGGSNYFAPCQKLSDFLAEKKGDLSSEVKASYKPGVSPVDMNSILPDFVSITMKKAFLEFDKKMKGFTLDDALLTGVETRSSSPVRIKRNENFQSNIKNVYPIGEGAGYAGGIMSSAVDGIKCAEKICQHLAIC
ncbi:MAG: FAD-binding protein [Clostridia bacterium]|nr:FAD-binding protein [Clostridia bacterium]